MTKKTMITCVVSVGMAAQLFAMAAKVPSIADKIAADCTVEKRDNGVTLAVVVKSASRSRVECVFPTSNTQDFIIKDGAGNVVWQWTKDRLFTDKAKKVQIDPNKASTFSVVWDYNDSDGNKVKAGNYQVTGILPVLPEPITLQPQKFAVTDTDLEIHGGFTVSGQIVIMGADVFIQSDDGISYLIANDRSVFKKLAGKKVTVFSSVIENTADSRSRKITITNYKVN